MRVQLAFQHNHMAEPIVKVIEVPDDTGDEALAEVAHEFMLKEINPHYWYDRVEE